ncbi:hypothetical protein E8E11_008451 [Didymella keratinophila]|nr:hypothetical protein E8E11_008451 [Didymella keratinophila]
MSNSMLDYEEKKEHDETPQSQDAHDVTISATNFDRPASMLATHASFHNDDDDASDAHSISGQRNTMTARQLRIAIPTLSVCLFVSFIDQTSVSTATPAIAGDLNTGAATSWIGTSFLIASTAFQLINGRLSDIFGRKGLLLVCLFLLAMGDLGCGSAQTAEQLFVLRAIAGIGGGGINSLVMIIVSDITTLQNRGKHQGWLGAVIALGNGIGPFLGGAVVEGGSWRWEFWMIPIMIVPTTLVLLFFLPLKHVSSNIMENMKKIDYGGIALNIASTLLLLVPLSGGGVTYAWSSAFFISATVVGVVLMILFVLYEWKLAPLPIMPLRLYRSYMHCILLGFALCTIGNGLTLMFSRTTGLGLLVPALIVEGAGIGLTLQPTLVGIYANSRTEDRAVTTGLRNFSRTIGGSFGLVVSGVILSNTLREGLVAESYVSNSLLSEFTSSTYALDNLDLTQNQQDHILNVYMRGLHYIFVFFTVCSGLSLILTCWVGNTSLKAPKPTVNSNQETTDGVEDALPSHIIDGQDTETDKLSTAEKGIYVDDRETKSSL